MKTETLGPGLLGNHRSTASGGPSTWVRPDSAKSTSSEQPTTRALPDVTLRDASWLRGERRDLHALSLLAFGLATAAVAGALLLH